MEFAEMQERARVVRRLCLWSVLSLADAYDVDLEASFANTMQELGDGLRSP